MKNIVKIILISLLVFNLTGCIFSDEDDNESSEEKTITENDTSENVIEEEIDLSDYEDSLAYSIMKNAWNYTNDNDIPIINFVERKNLLEFLNVNDLVKAMNNGVYVKDETGFLDDTISYKKTLDKSYFIYYGQLNDDNQPEGIGILFEYNYLSDYGEGYFLKYIGNFEEGTYSGYGIETKIKKIQGVDYSQKQLIMNDPLIYCSADLHEGYFKNGEPNGRGNYFSKAGESNDNLFCTTIGEFEDDTWNGQISYYWLNVLEYKGNTKNGDYNGQGTLYFTDTGKIKYKGEFSNGEYNGKGILYDKDGKVLHDGEFSNGDIK